jgi:hypothetical protein
MDCVDPYTFVGVVVGDFFHPHPPRVLVHAMVLPRWLRGQVRVLGEGGVTVGPRVGSTTARDATFDCAPNQRRVPALGESGHGGR